MLWISPQIYILTINSGEYSNTVLNATDIHVFMAQYRNKRYGQFFLSFMEIQVQGLFLFDPVFCFVNRMWLNYWKREWSPDFPIVKFIFLTVRHSRISLWYLRTCCSWMQSFLIKHFQTVGIIILRCVHLAFFALNFKCKKIGSQESMFFFLRQPYHTAFHW